MQSRFDHLLAVISGERFLKKLGIGNEVPFFICPFRPQEAVEMARMQQQLIRRLENLGVKVLDINLYDLVVELLKARNLWDRLLQMEASLPKNRLKETLQNVTDPAAHLVPAIAAKMQATEFDVMFLSGVGEVYPFIRSHSLLNNLQSTAKDKPTLLFFPGNYTQSLENGAALDLFCLLNEDRYYRAFNIMNVSAA